MWVNCFRSVAFHFLRNLWAYVCLKLILIKLLFINVNMIISSPGLWTHWDIDVMFHLLFIQLQKWLVTTFCIDMEVYWNDQCDNTIYWGGNCLKHSSTFLVWMGRNALFGKLLLALGLSDHGLLLWIDIKW